jgi:hypothetical protein
MVQESVIMKNALLAVLITTVCHDRVQAQNSILQVMHIAGNSVSLGYYNYFNTDSAVSISSLADGTATTDKLANDLFTIRKLADNRIALQKTADGDLTGCEQHLLPNAQRLQKPRPINSKRTGRLQL